MIVIPDYPEAASLSREDVVRVKHFADRSLQQIGNREWCFEVGGKVAPSAAGWPPAGRPAADFPRFARGAELCSVCV